MNTFVDIVEQKKIKDSEGFAATEDVAVASLRAYREGRHGSEKWANRAAFSEATLKKTDYDVKLVNGTKIEFSNSGKWTSVDCKTREVPEGIIPKTIRTYVKKNFPEVKIVKIEKTSTKYEVGLSDDVELTFNLLGQFKSMKMDD